MERAKGDTGPQGPAGAKGEPGEAGPRGPRGPSNVYQRIAPQSVTLAAFPGASAGTLPLPAGKYLVFAKAYIGFELGGSVLCDLHAAVPTGTLLADSSDVSPPSIGTVPLAMIGTLDVPLPTTLSLDSFANGAALAGAVQLSAIAVETIGP